MSTALALGFVVAALASALLTALVVPALRRAQIVDVPVDRSLHEAPVPRGGGLAVALAVAVTAGVVPLAALLLTGGGPTWARFDVVMLGLGTVLSFAVLGAVEDLFSLPPAVRFTVQIGLGLLLGVGACLETGAPLWLAPGVALCAAALVNITNFMDGANGLAAGHGLVTALWFTVVSLVAPVPGLGSVMVVVAGACLGFLPFNAFKARVFLGDTGSYALGGAWAFGATMCLTSGVAADASVAPLLVLVADTGYTLWMRVRAGQRWYQPHKLHIYQRLVTAGWPHWGSALLVSGVALVCAGAAWVDLRSGRLSLVPVVLMLAVLVGYGRAPALVGAPSPFHKARGLR